MEILLIGLSVYMLYKISVSIRNNILPIVIIRIGDDKSFLLQNLGSGSISNVIVFTRKNGYSNETSWQDPVRIRHLCKGEIYKIDWIEHNEDVDIGLMFDDVEGQPYYTTYINGTVNIRRGRLVKDLKPEEIGRPIAG